MIHKRYIIIIILFIISITILVVGITQQIQGCIFGGIMSIFCSAIITLGITMNNRYAVKIIKPRIVKDNATHNTTITITPTSTSTSTSTSTIITPIYETV